MGFLIEQGGGNLTLGLTAVDFKLIGTTIQIRNFATQAVIGVQPVNTLEAFPSGTGIGIRFEGGGTSVINELDITTISINTLLITQSPLSAGVDDINALLSNVGATGVAPIILNTPLTLNSLVGVGINFSALAEFMVSITWDFSQLPVGHDVAPVIGNHTQIIGASDAAIFPVGTYVITFTCINYYGSTAGTLNIVKGVAFVNTYSLYPSGTFVVAYPQIATQDDCPLYRPTNGVGAADAWTFACWNKQLANPAFIKVIGELGRISYTGGAAGGSITLEAGCNKIQLRYGGGGANNNLICSATNGVVADADWHLITITYDGGTTGNTAGDISLYYSRFNFYIDGVLCTPAWSNNSYGHTGAISAGGSSNNGWRIAWKQQALDETAVWETEFNQTQITALYNLGVPLDLLTSTGLGIPVPYNYLRWGDGTSGGLTDITGFPNIYDMGTSANDMTLYLGNVGMYISDTP